MKMWNEKGHFDYEGCVQVGTTINYGNNDSVHVTAENYTALRSVYIGRVVELGTSFSNPEIDSMGDWFVSHLNEQGIMEYVGVILVREGYAIRESDTEIRVIR